MQSARELLEAGLGELGIPVSPEQVERLLRFTELLHAWATRVNLTGHRTLAAIAHRLLLDAAALQTRLPSFTSLVDLGSGAGIPGIPIALLRPDSRITLVEARMRRHHFQRAACRELGLAGVTPLLGRAEELEPEPHALVIAQALARPEAALERMLRWASPGAWLAIPGSAESPPEPRLPGCQFHDLVSYQVPCGGPRRTLWLGRRAI